MTSTPSTPSPATMPKRHPKKSTPTRRPRPEGLQIPTDPATGQPVIIILDPTQAVDMKGIFAPTTIQKIKNKRLDGLVRASALKAGQRVQAWIDGEPKGGVHTVKSMVTKGNEVEIEWEDMPAKTVSTQRLFFDPSMEGKVVTTVEQVRALVQVH